MSFALVDHLQKGRFSNSRFVDASDLVDRIKSIKSAEERELIRRTAAMQDGAMRAAFAAVEPGMRDRDIAAIAQCYSQRQRQRERHLSVRLDAGRTSRRSSASAISRTASSRDGDVIALLVEDSGPGGMYTELGRTCVVGKASAELKDEFAFAIEARKFNLGLAQAGRALQGNFRRLQRLHAQERPPGGAAAALPRPRLRSGRAAAHPQRRADVDRART